MDKIDNIMALADQYAAAVECRPQAEVDRCYQALRAAIEQELTYECRKAYIAGQRYQIEQYEQALTPGEPYVWYDPETGETWTPGDIADGGCASELMPLYTAPQPQPKQEPVAWVYTVSETKDRFIVGYEDEVPEDAEEKHPIYTTASQPQRDWLEALREADRLMGHDDEATEWREKWAHLFYAAPQPQPWSEVACPHCNGSGLAEDAPQPQPKQEPVAWMVEDVDGRHFIFRMQKPTVCDGETLTPLYTAPQPQQWVGLTDEEVTATMQTQAAAVTVLISPRDQVTAREFQQALNHIARAVEAKLREKNGGGV